MPKESQSEHTGSPIANGATETPTISEIAEVGPIARWEEIAHFFTMNNTEQQRTPMSVSGFPDVRCCSLTFAAVY
jgi:hypothetical protein